MVNGELGDLGQYVNLIVRKQEQDLVTILLQLIEEEIVLEKTKMLQSVLEITAKLMVIGEIGVPGQYVNPTVRKEDPEHATILLQLIKEEIVLEKTKMLQNVLGMTAKLMEIEEIGVPGLAV